MENDNFLIMSTLSLLLFKIRHALTENRRRLPAAAATKSLRNYFRGFLILFPKDFQKLACKKNKEKPYKDIFLY
jgi:hypothetical protein